MYKQSCGYGVTESRRIKGTELYRQQKTRSKPPSLEALYSVPPDSLYKFSVSCLVFSHFNSPPPASRLSLLLHFNCDFHGYLTRSRSTCIKCPSGINLLLVLKPRLFGQGYPTDIPLTVRNSLTTTDFKKKLKRYFLSLN